VGADPASTALGRVLGLRLGDRPTVRDDGSRLLDGVLIRRLRWSVGYGPETTAWLLRARQAYGAICPACSGCTVMAAYGPLAVSSWSTSVLTQAHVLPGSARRITQVVARRTNWLVGATLCWYTTASRGAAGVSIYRAQRPGSPDSSKPKMLCGGNRG
jgi:hypothetical protein